MLRGADMENNVGLLYLETRRFYFHQRLALNLKLIKKKS